MVARTGIGFDAHRFEKGRPLRLAGVTISHDRGLSGHSDADVALHALADALLGAAALGDLGKFFPSSDRRLAGIDSRKIVAKVVAILGDSGWRPDSIDISIIAQEPRLQPHVSEMRKQVADLLGLSVSSVSVKATTTDFLGAVGRGEGIAALAVANIVTSLPSKRESTGKSVQSARIRKEPSGSGAGTKASRTKVQAKAVSRRKRSRVLKKPFAR